ncbi:tetratricopeptide repeat-containing glycosyltransferase family protein [Magnetospirillum sp. 15-1]|uniref:tetratricopeptide repeat-containing glycosyltransferase family protein n=1 Tax=Magnetospirillum sp. 15-1 TaxID=1979370 RepID=UPI001483BAE4|nr:tetratricopeptide repeat-containing glycosyltransferase family protein [Magnetospirillum sp. 15-1]
MNRKQRRAGAAGAVGSVSNSVQLRQKLLEYTSILTDNNLNREAEVICRGLLHASSDDFEATYNLAVALQLQGRLADAVPIYTDLLRRHPKHTQSWANLGAAQLDLGQPESGAEACRKALALDPNFAMAHINLSCIMTRLMRAAEGEFHGRQAVKLAPDNPNSYFCLGGSLNLLHRYDEAIEACRKGIALNANNANAHYTLGYALRELGRLEEAKEMFRRSIAISPNLAFAHYALGQTYLLAGQLAEGWEEYEWRWQIDEYSWLKNAHGEFSQPRWLGEAIAGRTIMVYAEQGFGDTIQFIRYIPLLQRLGARVILAVQPALKYVCRLLKDVTVIGLDEKFPPFDVHSPLLSLPRVFGTNLANVPAPTPYLEAEPELVEHWRNRLGQHGLRVGIIWQGRPGTATDLGRSPPLSAFEPLANIEGVRLISLQINHGQEQLATLPAGMVVETLGPDFDAGPQAFRDTLGVMANLDLVISSDTAIAHLAGTFGKPVWMPTKRIPDWRWLLSGDRSHWYPTMRLYRQPQIGDWGSVFARIASDLASLAAQRGVGQGMPTQLSGTGAGAAVGPLANLRG